MIKNAVKFCKTSPFHRTSYTLQRCLTQLLEGHSPKEFRSNSIPTNTPVVFKCDPGAQKTVLSRWGIFGELNLDNFNGDFLSISIFFAPSDSRFSNNCISSKYCPIHQRKAYLFSFQMIYKSQFRRIDPYDWVCGPGSHMSLKDLISWIW